MTVIVKGQLAADMLPELLDAWPPLITTAQKFIEDHLLEPFSKDDDEGIRDLAIDRLNKNSTLSAMSLIIKKQAELEKMIARLLEQRRYDLFTPSVHHGGQQLQVELSADISTIPASAVTRAHSGREKKEKVGGKKQGFRPTRGRSVDMDLVTRQRTLFRAVGGWDIRGQRFEVYHYETNAPNPANFQLLLQSKEIGLLSKNYGWLKTVASQPIATVDYSTMP